MKKIFYVILFTLSFINTQAQNVPKNAYSSVLFGELGGPGFMSINYDARFNKSNDGLGYRIGLGGFGGVGLSVLTVPLGVNYLASKDNRNYFETGAGFTYAAASLSSDSCFVDGKNSINVFGHLNLGYRLQPINGGFVFRVAINPLISSGGLFPFYGGVSFGYKF